MSTVAAMKVDTRNKSSMVELTGESSRKGPDLTSDERTYLQRRMEKNGGSVTTVDQLMKWLVDYRDE